MVHTIRKNNHGQNATVYGVVSDSFEFTFLRIDNDRRVSRLSQMWDNVLSPCSGIYGIAPRRGTSVRQAGYTLY
jgi:hypothetical protein